MNLPHRTRIAELLAIFAGREEMADLGQIDARDRRRLDWAVKHRIVLREQRPWPGPLVGTCIKTFYVRTGC